MLLAADEVRVVRVDLAAGDWTGSEHLLSRQELDRAARFQRPGDRQELVRSHAALRRALAAALGAEARGLEFVEGAHGKPELVGRPVRFSLSHSAGLALVAIAHHAVGVDAEYVRPGFEADVTRYLSPAERNALGALPAPLQTEAFFRAWVRKEAFLKACGTGLLTPLENFDVSLEPDRPPQLLATRPDPAEARRWSLATIEVPPGWLAAVAIAAGPHRLVIGDAAAPAP
jgi:4'-phosphopantetheinyl transferase